MIFEDITEVINKCVRWLTEKQIKDDPFHGGGLSPYPETVKAAGTLATADVLTFLQRSGIEEPDLIKKGVNFLVRAQIKENKADPSQNGGYPPMGDFELITNTSFADSTADALLGLLSVYRQIKDNNLQKEMSFSIENGIEWLLQCYTRSGALPIPTYIVDYNYGPKRFFPTLLTGIAFLTYKDYCTRINKNIRGEIDKYIRDLKTIILNKLNTNGFIPFCEDGKEISLMNTILAIEFINILKDNSRKNKDERDIQSALEKSYGLLLAKYKELLASNKSDAFTEFDPVHIYIPEISEGDYPATYFTLPPMIRLLVEPSINLVRQDFQELLNSLVSKLLTLVEFTDGSAYFWEYRGRIEPATSATASAIYALKMYVEVMK